MRCICSCMKALQETKYVSHCKYWAKAESSSVSFVYQYVSHMRLVRLSQIFQYSSHLPTYINKLLKCCAKLTSCVTNGSRNMLSLDASRVRQGYPNPTACCPGYCRSIGSQWEPYTGSHGAIPSTWWPPSGYSHHVSKGN